MPTCATSRQCFPTFTLWRDLHQVVDLRPVADRRLAERGAVDRASGADLDVVADAHDADLRDLVMPSALRGEAVAVRADDDAAVDDAALADDASARRSRPADRRSCRRR